MTSPSERETANARDSVAERLVDEYGKAAYWRGLEDGGAINVDVDPPRAALLAHFDQVRNSADAEIAKVMAERDAVCNEIDVLWEKIERRAEDNDALREENARITDIVDCAVNALTDSICVSGNDAETNLHWVRKLKRALAVTESQHK